MKTYIFFLFSILYCQITVFAMNLKEINKKIKDKNWTINYHEDYLKKENLSEYSKNSSLKAINTALVENNEFYQQQQAELINTYKMRKEEKEKLELEYKNLLEENKDIREDHEDLLGENAFLNDRQNALQQKIDQKKQKDLQDIYLMVGASGLLIGFFYLMGLQIKQQNLSRGG